MNSNKALWTVHESGRTAVIEQDGMELQLDLAGFGLDILVSVVKDDLPDFIFSFPARGCGPGRIMDRLRRIGIEKEYGSMVETMNKARLEMLKRSE